jgi:hypothetical protein
MSLLSKLFGGAPKGPVAEEYQGFHIIVEPIKDGKRFRLAARIERDVDGDVKVHQLIRADTLESFEAAIVASRSKAQQVIDEQGDRIFRYRDLLL